MEKPYTLIITLFLLSGCKSENKQIPTIANKRVPQSSESIKIKEENRVVEPFKSENISLNKYIGKQMLISSGQLKKAEEIILYKCVFDVVVDENLDTIYLATSDPNFMTDEKFNVGTKLSQIPAGLKNNMQKENGWGYYVLLDSQWNIGFCEGSTCTDKSLTDNSTIKWIFKRK